PPLRDRAPEPTRDRSWPLPNGRSCWILKARSARWAARARGDDSIALYQTGASLPSAQGPAVRGPVAVQGPAIQDPAVQGPALQDPALQDPAVQDLAVPIAPNPKRQQA